MINFLIIHKHYLEHSISVESLLASYIILNFVKLFVKFIYMK